MARAIALRPDFTGVQLRALARHSKNASQARRLLALWVIYDGGARSEAARLVEPGRHAVLLLDQAGWHLSADLEVPANITVLPLPAKCPELNVMENVWQFMRDNWLSNRVFTDDDDIVSHCCFYWNRLVDQPWRIISIGMRDWAHRF